MRRPPGGWLKMLGFPVFCIGTDGLIVPVIRDADMLTLDEVAVESSRLAPLARSGSSRSADISGGTFSVSTLGSFGVNSFAPVINPPSVGILGMRRLREELGLVGSAVVVPHRFSLSLTWDHQVLDGEPATAFCKEIVDRLAEHGSFDEAATRR